MRIFWLHHCTIDRIWAAWNDHGGKNPVMSRKFAFADQKGGRIEMDARDVGETKTLGYSYDSLPPKPQLVQLAMSTSSSSESTIASSNAAPKVLGTRPTRIALTPTAPLGEIGTAVSGTEEDQRLVIEIAGIRCATQPGTLYEVFVDLPSDPSAETKREHYVGTFNFFGATDAEAVARFDATVTLRRLRAANRLTPQTSVYYTQVGAIFRPRRAP
ncbi:MAG: tyrosinase family protein [Gammaproteobacteria bacterium]|nr:tyrosinase family protein [Gammaproteobacteria bacterium]